MVVAVKPFVSITKSVQAVALFLIQASFQSISLSPNGLTMPDSFCDVSLSR